jgi:N-methylhydantoinase A
MSYRLGVDVGGTFTDLLLFDGKKKNVYLEKVPTTVENQAIGIVQGVKKIARQAGIRVDDIDFFMHGTTVATNAILEGKGVRTALITTRGFRDVLHIMRQDRPKLYSFFARRPEALIPRHLRFEVTERILYTGKVHKKLDEAELKRIIARIRKEKVAAVAICLLHSYANPAHERRIRQVLHRACNKIRVSLSSDVLPEIKEYERMSTTAVNAAVSGIVDNYMGSLTRSLREQGFRKNVHVMQSNGGAMPAARAGEKSVSTVLSGPAAGVLGGVALARQAGFANAITVDMGGTSFDICLAHNGEFSLTRECEIGGHALKVPMIDMHTIGAGGGSIAWIDAGGMLKVGPRSAGASPGPACYAKGGEEPTVTDANLVLGRLNPDYFLGGEMTVNPRAAYATIERRIARPLGLDVLEAAEGITRVINASMVKGIRRVSVERGHDPREFALVCFGGNGPVHAVELARELGIPRIIVPFAPGVNCAYGLLMGDFRFDYVRTYLTKSTALDLRELENLFEKFLERPARARMLRDGVAEKDIDVARSLDLRYLGQGYELEVPAPSGNITRGWWQLVEDAFHALYEKKYGFCARGETLEIVNLRLACFGRLPKPRLPKGKPGPASSAKSRKGYRQVFLNGRFLKAAIHDRALFAPGMRVSGPAIIEQKDSTTVLFPGSRARIDEYRNILITVEDLR